MTELSDPELLSRYHAGEAGALDALFERHESPLYCFLLGILHNPHQAEDALQETFVRALERLDGVDPEHLRGWLFTVAYHQAMLLRRREAGRAKHVRFAADPAPEESAATSQPGPLENAQREEEAARLRELLEKLPANQREV